MKIDELPQVVTVKQLADFLQLNQVTVLRALQKRELKGFKIGKDWRMFKEEVQVWINKKEN